MMMGRHTVASDEKPGGLNSTTAAKRDGAVLRYNRDEMMTLSESTFCKIRPAYLSTDFDNDDGLFSPYKWLEYRWATEGTENRPAASTRRKDKIKNDALDGDSTVLSPQRRGFSSGCRAASPNKAEADPERLTTKGSWRTGAGYQLKASAGGSADFKPSFQKSTAVDSSYSRNRTSNGVSGSAGGSNWRAAGDGFKPNFHRDNQSRNRQSAAGGDEKIPEWLSDGPASMLDMIELKGFDDEHNPKRGSGKNKKEKDGQGGKQSSAGGAGRANATSRAASAASEVRTAKCGSAESSAAESRPSSLASANGSGGSVAKGDEVVAASRNATPAPAPSAAAAAVAAEPAATSTCAQAATDVSSAESNDLGKQKSSPEGPTASNAAVSIPAAAASKSPVIPLLNCKLPNSDAEFAAIMGILGENDLDALKENGACSPSVMQSESAPSVTGSRLSRFFATNANGENRNPGAPSRNDSNNNAGACVSPSATPSSSSNSVLQKIFANSPMRSAQSPLLFDSRGPAASIPGMLRVEDLERGFQQDAVRHSTLSTTLAAASDAVGGGGGLGLDARAYPLSRQQLAFSQISKGNPLGDPHQQAHLMSKLNKFARQQDLGVVGDEMLRPPPPPGGTVGSPPVAASHSGVPSASLPSAAGLPSSAAEAAAATPYGADAAALQAAVMRSQYENAFLQSLHAIAANQQRAASAQSQQPHPSAIGNFSGAGGSGMPSTGSAPGARGAGGLPNAFMPTSVMRQMTKNASLDEKLRRAAAGGDDEPMPTASDQLLHSHKQGMDGGMSGLPGAGAGPSDAMAKLALQQQYAQVMAAMQGGLSMNAYRAPAQFAAAIRSQALAASQAEHQRAFALALMRGDLGQAQAIRARFLTQQQAAAVANHPPLAGAGVGAPAPPTMPFPIPQQHMAASSKVLPSSASSSGTGQGIGAPMARGSVNSFKYQNPLEMLLQSGGVATSQNARTLGQHNPSSTSSGSGGQQSSSGGQTVPSIISRLPPQANCISLEELERQFAAN